MATLTLRSLTRRHESTERPALDQLSIEVGDGELLVVVGPSGCGKSTALRLIAGLDTPDGGSVHIDDRNVTHTPPQDRDVAMVFQGYALYPHLTARDNIAFPLKMKGIARAERDRRVGEVADMLGLAKLLDRHPGALSGGERQRVAMGRAIVRRPKVFLFDEPLANLDAALRAELRVELASLVRRLRTTAIYVTHDQAEAMTMGDRICVLNAGTLQQIDKPRAIYETPANLFVASFLGAPPMNLIEGARAPLPLALNTGLPDRITLGARPEHVHITAAKEQQGHPADVYFEANVVDAEPLGAETHVRLDADGTLFWARAPGFDAPARGSRVHIRIPFERLHWFNTETRERIDPPQNGGP
ncbi:MAG: ABC transporter ATP-binding protein [Polyangiaceae bacterium]|nr:ABC transporter ATP-binding protein [Polyangiaceae bacterium]